MNWQPGDRVKVTGFAESCHDYSVNPITFETNPPRHKWIEFRDFDKPMECMILGWTMRYEGVIQRWSETEQPELYTTKKIKVWVVMPLTHNRYRKTFVATPDQIERSTNEDADPNCAHDPCCP